MSPASIRLRFVVVIAGAMTSCNGCAPERCVGFRPVALADHAIVVGELTIPSYVTAERVDVLIDWSALTSDFDCQPLDPVDDIGAVVLTRFPHLSESEVASSLVNNTMLQSDTNGFVWCSPREVTQCWLSEFGFGGSGYSMIDAYSEDGGVYLLMFLEDGEEFSSVRFFAFLSPQSDSTVTVAAIVADCPQAMLTASLDLSTPVEISAAGAGEAIPRALPLDDSATCDTDTGPSWPVDWEDLGVNASELVVSRYTLPIAELEARFGERDALAAERYALAVSETNADLADAVSTAGSRFAGFTGEGLWLVELRGSSWFEGAAPLVVTVVEPTARP
ncbi:hypothetical protein LBMAG42_22570 [Deltaproteobacteria bacterium]|nr:hypothetical protein LBMAG42_22570 [Deltaproteobacteria bacterium]